MTQPYRPKVRARVLHPRSRRPPTLVVPTGPDCTVFNTTRVYGDARLKRLLDGWTTVDRHRHQEPLLHGRGEDRSLFVLSNAA